MTDQATVEFWNGVSIPPIGCYAGYITASSGLTIDTVSGYDVKECSGYEYGHHRVFVNFTGGNCRLLHDVVSVHRLEGQAGG